MGQRKGQYYQVCTDKVKVPRTFEKHRHILTEDPQKTDNDSSDSITEPPPAKRILRSQVGAFDKNKCAINFPTRQKMFTKNKGARSRQPQNKRAIGSASLLKAAEILDYTDAFHY